MLSADSLNLDNTFSQIVAIFFHTSYGILDNKIAFTQDAGDIGMYHEKIVIVTDVEGNIIAFSGSNNESATAMQINYENMDVFCSWGGKSESERVDLKRNAFTSIWYNSEPNIKVLGTQRTANELTDTNKFSVRRITPNIPAFIRCFPIGDTAVIYRFSISNDIFFRFHV